MCAVFHGENRSNLQGKITQQSTRKNRGNPRGKTTQQCTSIIYADISIRKKRNLRGKNYVVIHVEKGTKTNTHTLAEQTHLHLGTAYTCSAGCSYRFAHQHRRQGEESHDPNHHQNNHHHPCSPALVHATYTIQEPPAGAEEVQLGAVETAQTALAQQLTIRQHRAAQSLQWWMTVPGRVAAPAVGPHMTRDWQDRQYRHLPWSRVPGRRR